MYRLSINLKFILIYGDYIYFNDNDVSNKIYIDIECDEQWWVITLTDSWKELMLPSNLLIISIVFEICRVRSTMDYV